MADEKSEEQVKTITIRKLSGEQQRALLLESLNWRMLHPTQAAVPDDLYPMLDHLGLVDPILKGTP